MAATRIETVPLDNEDDVSVEDGESARKDGIDDASVEDEVPDDVSSTEPEVADTARRRVRTWFVLAVLVVAFAALVGSGWVWFAGRSVEAERSAALAAARDAAVALTSIDFNSADRDIDRVVGSGTGEFGQLFEKNLGSYVKMVRDSKVTSTGEVAAASLSEFDDGTAQTLLAVRSEVKNSSSPQGQQRQYRMKLDMVKEGDRWLVSKLEFVG